MQFAPTRDLELALARQTLDLEADVGRGLPQQAFLQVAAGDELALAAREGAVVDEELHREGRLVDRHRDEALGSVRSGHGVSDLDALQARHRHDVAGPRRLDLPAGQAHETLELHHLGGDAAPPGLEQSHRLAAPDHPVGDAADPDLPHEVIVVKHGHLKLQGLVGVGHGRGDMLEHRLEERRQVLAAYGVVSGGPAFLARRVEDGKVELVGGSPEIHEQAQHLIEHALGPSVGTVELVDHDDRGEPQAQSLAQDKARLRHGAVHRVDQQKAPLHHAQHPFDLGAEVGVARGIDDVDGEVLVGNRGALGEYGNAPLALERV